ncbi:MAG: hypothetical protein IH611_13265 [Deltaproteobacteria bacterium]|nr:hypothetical protein [Deltaproteobacteria bacterium]
MARGIGHEGDLLAALLLAAALFCAVPARVIAQETTAGRGFGGVKWGDTVEEAMQTCPDLRFEGYRIVRDKDAPFRAFVRSRTAKRVYGVRFDSLEYWFRENGFLEIHAVLQSRIGPRTLVTEAERSYDVLAERIRKTSGNPAEHTVKYVTRNLAVVKETAWTTQGVTIRLKYQGAEEGDVDRLTLEMGRKGGAP